MTVPLKKMPPGDLCAWLALRERLRMEGSMGEKKLEDMTEQEQVETIQRMLAELPEVDMQTADAELLKAIMEAEEEGS